MTALPFLDTNVFLRHLVQDHDDHSPRATLYFDRIEHGGLRVETTMAVVFEIVFTFQSLCKHPRPLARHRVAGQAPALTASPSSTASSRKVGQVSSPSFLHPIAVTQLLTQSID